MGFPCDYYFKGRKLTYDQFRKELKGLPMSEIEEMFPSIKDEGISRISWTTGEQQNDRYDLSKQVDEIGWQKNENGTYNITPKKDGSVVGTRDMMANLTLKQVEDYVGKDIAGKIQNDEGKVWEGGNVRQGKLTGKQLKVGGKGMKGFYGQPEEGKLGIVGNVAKSLWKQYPHTIIIETAKNNEYTLGEANYVGGIGVYDGKGDMVAEFDTKKEADKFISEKQSATQHSITITPEMREQAQEGQPLFMKNKGLTPMQLSVLDKSDFDKDGNVKPEVAEAIKKEYADIEAKAKADGTWKKALDGTESELSDKAWVQVRSSRFKKNFFGDFEKAYKEFKEGKYKTLSEALTANDVSQVVGENGEPLAVYHGSRSQSDFSVFDSTKGNPINNGGHYFSNSKEFSQKFAGKYGKVFEVFLNIKNPNLDGFDGSGATMLKSAYRDGGIFTKRNTDRYAEKGTKEYIVFSPNQIKSATDNVGTFSSESNDIRFQILGEKGAAALDRYDEATHRMDNLSVAREMEAAGKTAKEVRLATGWEKGKDGKWRYEIGDYLQAVSDVYELQGKRKGVVNEKASLFGSKELNKAYPELENVQVKITISDDAKNNGSYENLFINGKKDSSQITVNATDVSKAQSILLHEIQHAIQDIEGFAKGGNEKVGIYLGNKRLNEAKFKLNQFIYKNDDKSDAELEKMAEYQKLDNDVKIAKLESENGNINYSRLSGEVEARNVQSRLNMTPEQRRETLLSETEDVAREDQIVIMRGINEALSLGIEQATDTHDVLFQNEEKSPELNQWIDVVQSYFEDNGRLSLKETQDKIADDLGGSRQYDDIVAEAYNEATKTLKVTGEEGQKPFRGEGEKTTAKPNELSSSFVKRINNFIAKVYGQVGDKVKVLKNAEALAKKATELDDVNFQQITNSKGEILGFIDTATGDIYLNGEKLNPNTPLHEAGHIYLDWLEANQDVGNNEVVFNEGLKKVRGSKYLAKVKGSDFYKAQALTHGKEGSAEYERYMEKEALAHAIGDNGAQFFMETQRKSFREWASELWNKVAEFFGIKNKTADEIRKMTLGEFSKHIAADILDPSSEFAKSPKTEEAEAETAKPDVGEKIGAKQALVAEIREELGLPDYERIPTTHLEIIAEAKALYAKKGQIDKIMQKAEEKVNLSPAERIALLIHLHNLKEQVSKTPTTSLLGEIKRVADFVDRDSSRAGSNLAANKIMFKLKDPENLGDYYLAKMQDLGVDNLTIEQKIKFKKDFEDLQAAKKAYEAHINKKLKEQAKKDADTKVKRTKSRVDRGIIKSMTPEEREAKKKQILDRIKKRKKGQGGDVQFAATGGVPTSVVDRQLAKDIDALAKIFVQEVDGVENVAQKVVAELAGVENISVQDVYDVLAGKYNIHPSKSDLAIKMENLRIEAKLTQELQEVLNGNVSLLTQLRSRRRNTPAFRNQLITDLRQQIADIKALNREREAQDNRIQALEKKKRDLEKELNDAENGIFTLKNTTPTPKNISAQEQALMDEIKELQKKINDTDVAKLELEKERMRKAIKKIDEKIAKKEFETTTPTTPPLDAEGAKLKAEYVRKKSELAFEKLKDMYSKTDKLTKWTDYAADILNIPRAVMATGDYSAMLRQGLIPTISNPALAAKATAAMLKAGTSQSFFDTWYFDLENKPDYDVYVKAGLGLSDPNSPFLRLREERFMSNIAERIPIVGAPVKIKGKTVMPGLNILKGSERAYSMYLNYMRVELFDKYAALMRNRGLTIENSPNQYKELAAYVNNVTGRGDVFNFLDKAVPLLNGLFFSPRLIASRVNMLTYLVQPRFYTRVPREIRSAYFADMGLFIAAGVSTLAAFAALGSTYDDDDPDKIFVSIDPLSTDFGKIRQGNTDWDIWGGFQQFVRLFIMLGAKKRRTQTGRIKELDGSGAYGETRATAIGGFFRKKASPVAGMFADVFLFGDKTVIGQKIVWDGEPNESKNEISGAQYLREHFIPMNVVSMFDAMDDRSFLNALATSFIPNLVGIGTNTYPRQQKQKSMDDLRREAIEKFRNR